MKTKNELIEAAISSIAAAYHCFVRNGGVDYDKYYSVTEKWEDILVPNIMPRSEFVTLWREAEKQGLTLY